MPQTPQRPALTAANQLYLYRLLARTIGCGKQTFITRVEEALATDRMTAEDLGFESTRALLEELSSFVTLTVFKGGRIYATVVAQPAWDATLAADEQEKPAPKSGKPVYRKGRTKDVRPVRPKRMKRAAAETAAAEPAEAVGTEAPAESPAETAAEAPAAPAAAPPEASAAFEEEHPQTPATSPEAEPEKDAEPPVAEAEPKPAASPEAEAVAPAEPAPEPEPAAAEPEATAEPKPPAAATRPAPTAPQPAATAAAARASTPPSNRALESYPADFSTEVYLPAALDALLAASLPFGATSADALTTGIASARQAAAIAGNRSQASFTFPLPDTGLSCTATIKRRPGSTIPWALIALRFSL